jgi:hypothetical protein
VAPLFRSMAGWPRPHKGLPDGKITVMQSSVSTGRRLRDAVNLPTTAMDAVKPKS